MTVRRIAWLAAAATLVAIHALLVLNPGYFSHDELQWGAFAQGPSWRDLPWQDFLDLSVYQYRPLTFDAWLVLSRLLFDSPRAMHAVWALLGMANAGLLFLVLRRSALPVRGALAGAALFLACPYAVYVHGWVATLADLLWVGVGLALLAWLQGRCDRPRPADAWAITATAALATAVALLCKESALSLPAMLVVGAAWSRRSRIGWAALGSCIVGAVYLLLRAEAILGASEAATGYAWSAASPPVRLLEYLAFPFHFLLVDAVSFVDQPLRTRLLAAFLALSYLIALRRPGRLLWFLAATAAALGPVLLLETASSQYGYAFSAVAASALAAAWHHGTRLSRVAITVIALFWAAHGLRVAMEMHRVGTIQSRFSPAVAELVRDRAEPVSFQPLCMADAWIYRRLLHDVPRYRDVAIAGPARIAQSPLGGVVLVHCDGTLGAFEPGRTTSSPPP